MPSDERKPLPSFSSRPPPENKHNVETVISSVSDDVLRMATPSGDWQPTELPTARPPPSTDPAVRVAPPSAPARAGLPPAAAFLVLFVAAIAALALLTR